MASWAVSLGGVSCLKRIAPQQVLTASHYFEVTDTHTSGVTAKVIELESWWHRPNYSFIEPLMGEVGFTITFEFSIATTSFPG
jgi:hypothetical protein